MRNLYAETESRNVRRIGLAALVVVLVGCNGSQGPAGSTGTTGPQGPAGSTGPQGPPGVFSGTFDGGATFMVNDSQVSGIATNITLAHATTGVSNGGVGAQIMFEATNDGGVLVATGSINGILSNSASGSEAGALTFQTALAGNSAEQMRIDSTGNVGIGTNAPNTSYPNIKTLNVAGVPGTPGHRAQLQIMGNYESSSDVVQADLIFGAATNTAEIAIGHERIAMIRVFSHGPTANNRGGILTFKTKPDGSNDPTERLRIDSTGQVGIGNFDNPPATLSHPLQFSTALGGAYSDGTNWITGSSRDYKEDIRPFSDALSMIEKVPVYKYRYRPDHGSDRRERIGVIAEELPDEVSSMDHKGAPTGELIALSIAADRALIGEVNELRRINAEQNAQLKVQAARLNDLERRLEAFARSHRDSQR